MAVAHYQFEAIHPFSDGNGRTGRVFNSLFLVEQQLLPLPILYLNRFLIARTPDYYGRLLGVTRDVAWEPWILFMLQGIEETASWPTAKIGSIREQQCGREKLFVNSRLLTLLPTETDAVEPFRSA